MRVCASLSSSDDIASAGNADLLEFRTDIFGSIPDIDTGRVLVTFTDGYDPKILPEGFSGMIDVGPGPIPQTGLLSMSSHHDYGSTPDAERIIGLLSGSKADIVKGAFAVKGFRDLVSILDAARSMKRRHILVGMGDLGRITRIRSELLGNEFTFASVGEDTAPGQLKLDRMQSLGDGCLVTGIVGRPLSKSLSPAMHDAAMKAAGIDGVFLPFESPDLDLVEEAVLGYGIRGMNVTVPYKQEIIDHLDRVDGTASEIGAVNTVVNENGILSGYNTDVAGIDAALSEAGIEADDMRVLIMGSGGAARTCAQYMVGHGCDVTVTGRNRDTGEDLAREFGCVFRRPDSVSVKMHDLVVNCTPVGMYSDGPYPVNIASISSDQAVFDMAYGKETALTSHAKRMGCRIADGKDMLAGQGAASFAMWTGVEHMFPVMRSALE